MSNFRFRILHPAVASRLRMQPVMHGMAGLLFLFNAIGIYNSIQANWFMAGFFLLLGIASMALPFALRKHRNFTGINAMARIIQVFVCLSGCLYFLSHLYPLAALFMLIAGIGLGYVGWAEYKMFQPAFVKLENTGITVPTTFSTHQFSWNQLNNVILNNDLLTLDFRSNKILQLEVLDNIHPEQAAAINTYCKSRL
ncbi:hypothetical protein KTO58_06420 [Chitinophaga pendula]|uniref:hypothetical protein n=1 Tax=Chitinophaga TaxID=79328 RepID=UPI0012FE2AB3|nr:MULTISPECIES: hypothetical protein [Chitinophaga]UCJ08818.1 hypothetical protein KTO58_06420 [Chitinophaga pendula]